MDVVPEDFPLKPVDCDGRALSAGDIVVIRSVESCAQNLPMEDQTRLLELVGKQRAIVQFDRFGFVWLSLSAKERGADFSLFPAEVSRV